MQDERRAFQLEKEDLLDSVRELTRQLKLKTLVLENFVPEDGAQAIERRACWNHEKEDWDLPR